MRNTLFFVLLLFSTLGSQAFQNKNKSSKNQPADIAAARAVLYRVLGDRANSVKLEILKAVEGRDTYEYFCTEGELTVTESSVSALTRGVYDYLKNNHLGMLDWSGPQFRLPRKWPDSPLTKVTTPFRIRQWVYGFVPNLDKWLREYNY